MKLPALIICFTLLFFKYTSAQEIELVSPVRIPILLSGSFAELRSNHFHSGIDIKTQGITKIPVYSIADGYISRIVVSPGGFGKALYLNHPNGTTSVYGHLDKFRDDIEQCVKNIQYNNKSFRIDEQISGDRFPVNQNDLIGFSGNSGSSGGPHLHFELRNTKSEEPVNPLKYNFPVKDDIPPKIFSVMIVPLGEYSHCDYQTDKKIYLVITSSNEYILSTPVIPVYGPTGFAIEVNDYFNGSNNRCGVYSILLKIDGEPYYSFQMDRFSFEETNYINSHIDYETLIKSKRRFHKTWLDPGNRLGIYNYIRDNGIYNMNDGNIHPVSIEVKDIHGNKSVLNFRVESRAKAISKTEENYSKHFRYDRFSSFYDDSIKIELPPGSLYEDLRFFYERDSESNEFISPIHIVHNNTVPLHKSARLSIQVRNNNGADYSKALLVNVDTISGNFYSCGGQYKKGWVTGDLRTFGNYAVAIDTVPPVIKPLSIKNRAALTESNRIRFRITDELSGISTITGFMDDKWALFEYDAKTDMIVHYFDPERFEMKRQHTLKLIISDQKGNTSTYEARFYK
jgi:hypothetical protein